MRLFVAMVLFFELGSFPGSFSLNVESDLTWNLIAECKEWIWGVPAIMNGT